MSRKGLFSSTIVLFVMLMGAAAVNAYAPHAAFTVNSTTDAVDAAPGNGTCATAGSACTLRAAIQEANALAGDDTITVPAGTYTLTLGGAGEDAAATGDLDITSNLTLNGAGAATCILDSGVADRVFHVTGAFTVNISGVTIRDGNTAALGGGGIRNDDGTLTINDSAFSYNSVGSGGDGGGIYSSGTLAVTNSTFSYNSAGNGGSIYSSGTLAVTGSTFSSDSAGNDGGSILSSGTATVTNSTFSDNSAGTNGGAILNSGALTVTGSTFSSNSADNGGGIYDGGGNSADNAGGNSADNGGGNSADNGGDTITITTSTFIDNSAWTGGGIFTQFAVTVANSTFSENSGSPGDDTYTDGGTLTIINSTIFGYVSDPDSADGAGRRPAGGGGGVYNNGGAVTLRNTIVASHESGGNCVGVITNGGNNLDDGTTCGWGSANGSMSSTDALFGALDGSPGYFPLNAGSPAIDAGDNATCAAAPVNNASQNGVTRPIDGDGNGAASCDIGSYEASGETIISGGDWHIEYDGWGGVGAANASGGSYRLSNIKKNKAIFKFSGDSIRWVTTKGPDRGIAQVFIDKKPMGTFDLYSPTVKYKVKKTFKGLGSGKHRLVVRVSGDKNANATDTFVSLDAFVVGNTTTDESSPKITYNYWKGVVNANASSGALRMSKKKRSKAVLTFTGTSVNWITALGPKYGNANVLIDGVDKGNFDLYSPTQQFQVVRTFGGLSAGQHTIQVRPLRTKNAASGGYWAVVDAFSGPITLPGDHEGR